ncbi:hypothetical protein KOW79_010484 [Hemibagrus wyckioides]|uniref:Uncharacterized protein n=1 Tax=Hemibagrus wyckioides TaxID=337641 RepID=A0A9D3NQ96_9TELE|nr:hypothetical protein KOW79_010484 [Hemibagrus wyckioides]
MRLAHSGKLLLPFSSGSVVGHGPLSSSRVVPPSSGAEPGVSVRIFSQNLQSEPEPPARPCVRLSAARARRIVFEGSEIVIEGRTVKRVQIYTELFGLLRLRLLHFLSRQNERK